MHALGWPCRSTGYSSILYLLWRYLLWLYLLWRYLLRLHLLWLHLLR